MKRKTAFSRQQGLATVELALATPFLLVMMLVSAEFTRVFYQYNTLTKSVRDAARWAAEDAYVGSTGVFDITDKINEARNIAVYGTLNGGGTALLPGLDVADISVTQRNLGAAPAIREHVEVTATYEYNPLAPSGVISRMFFLPADVDANFTLTATSTMRAL